MILWLWVFASSFKAALSLAAVALLLLGCSTAVERADRLAADQGLASHIIQGDRFQHKVYSRLLPHAPALHVYLGGDGKPWLQGFFVADDPTPGNALALKMMASVDYNAVYLGRPCYFGLASTSPCEPIDWTHGRYGAEVIGSLHSAVAKLRKPGQPVLLIGYSGGGALAVLLASQLRGDVSVLTIAANLDTELWTKTHNYLPLEQSLNPFVDAQLEGKIHRHLAGGRDENVNSEHAIRFAERHGGDYEIFPEFDHVCCWLEQWPQILNSFISSTAKANTLETP